MSIEAMKLALDGGGLYEITGRIEDIDKCIVHRSVLVKALAKQDRKYWCSQTEALCNKCKDVCEAEQEQGEPVAWKSLEKFPPPIDQALDDDSVSSRRRVLVTNNINATNRMGQPSHVWFVSPQRVKKGEWVGFTDSMQKVEALTHWLDPFDTTPQQRTWVGLNWDDLPEIYVGDIAFLHGAKWAEAKLKEKNT